MNPGCSGLRRSLALWRAFRVEQTDPDRFYRVQAADTVEQLSGYADLAGKVVLDVGGGAGWFTVALRGAGATCFLVEPEAATGPDEEPDDDPVRVHHRQAVQPARLARGAAVAGDGLRLPFHDGAADVVLSSNVLEHVADQERFIDEAVRATKAGGVIYLSFTTWLSPWGGHETAPWHYLGGRRAARRYSRRHGRPPGNLYGTSLFPCYVGPILRALRARNDVELLGALPRYHPRWLWWMVRVPGLREVVTWNLLVVLRRRPSRLANSGADNLPWPAQSRYENEVGRHS